MRVGGTIGVVRNLWPLLLTLPFLLPSPPAAAQESKPTARARAVAQFASYRAKEHRLGLLALRIRRPQERYLRAREALFRFRQGKTRKELAQAKNRLEIDRLERVMLRAQKAYEAVARGPAVGRYRALKEEVGRELGRVAGALRRAIKESPQDIELRVLRAALLVDKGRFRLASRDLDFALEKQPKHAQALSLKGRCLEATGHAAQAVAHYKRALAAEPRDEFRARAAVALYWLNHFGRARALRDQVKAKGKLPAQLQLDFDWFLAAPGLERQEKRWARELALRKAEAARDDLPRVELETSRGKIVLELFEDQVPNTVANFVELVEKRFFDGLTWHRVQPLRLAVTGKPSTRAGHTGKDPGGPGYGIRCELTGKARGHFRGSIGLLIGRKRTGGSQFYVMLRPDPELDRHCPVFGRILKGLDVAARLRKDDLVKTARVLRKRKHPYVSEKIK